MESVFCFDIAVDFLKLRKAISCQNPAISFVFLKFPTIFICPKETKQEKSNKFSFQNGKSCLFKMSPTELLHQLTATPVYVVVIEQNSESDCKQNICIGTSNFDLSEAIKKIISDIQNFGFSKVSSCGESCSIGVYNLMEDVVGFIDIAYKLTCLGHTMLPHLPIALKCDHASNHGKENIDTTKFKYIHFATKDNSRDLTDPPALFYQAKKKEKKAITDTSINKSSCCKISMAKQDEKVNTKNNSEDEKRESVVRQWRDKAQNFIKVYPNSGQKTESTQTDLQHLNQFPILQSLIAEVVELGLNYPPQHIQQTVSGDPSLPRPAKTANKPRPYSFNILERKRSLPTPARQHHLTKSGSKQKRESKQPEKKRGLTYGLTKTHLLRKSLNKQSDFSKTYTKFSRKAKPSSTKKLPMKRSQKNREKSLKLISTFTQTVSNVKENDIMFGDEVSDDESIDLPFNENDFDVRSISPDKSSPRVMSRQSIEIRLPSAKADELSEREDKSEMYKYSDDFDDDHSTVSNHSSSFVASTLGTDVETASPKRLSLSVSPQPTMSDRSPTPVDHSVTPGDIKEVLYFRDSIPEEPEKEYMESVASLKESNSEAGLSPHVLNLPSSPSGGHLSSNDLSPKLDSQIDGSKPTDDSSASVITTLIAPKLPMPAPSSDSPVIRSLVSEAGSRKPRPPTVSHSSSYERIHRKYRRSSDSSFHMSDISDIRSSELADIRTSELSDLKTDENMSPMHSVEVTNAKASLPTLKNQYKY